MTLYGQIKAEFSKYRKRKKLSTDGSIQGAYISKNTPSEKAPGWHFAIDLPHHTHEYDPAHTAYEFHESGYRPTQTASEEAGIRPTEQIRLDPIEIERPERLEWCYENSIMTPELMAVILERLAEAQTPTESATIEEAVWQPPGVNDTIVIEEDPAPNMPQIEQAQMPPETIPETPNQTAVAALEQIVEQEFRQFEAAMQPQAEQMMEDPFEQQMKMYGLQMQQMFAPFMMPGGFGPQPPMM